MKKTLNKGFLFDLIVVASLALIIIIIFLLGTGKERETRSMITKLENIKPKTTIDLSQNGYQIIEGKMTAASLTGDSDYVQPAFALLQRETYVPNKRRNRNYPSTPDEINYWLAKDAAVAGYPIRSNEWLLLTVHLILRPAMVYGAEIQDEIYLICNDGVFSKENRCAYRGIRPGRSSIIAVHVQEGQLVPFKENKTLLVSTDQDTLLAQLGEDADQTRSWYLGVGVFVGIFFYAISKHILSPNKEG
ncbi:hypothetical protein PAALTS15_07374 [Paenibacillus alvei TS-15]|uniref:Uncharacterized protein n=1 Tax=Paenibacillus alvei TS-15 TaxID=1117108 RepID=S9SQP9_PAEAL|nr:hypothetical protein [Paenibacillus alvei]EPY08047.1 hypothetical protein PAALTS15_07374 [Paenibacillus alvei TS-15]